jgi:hypothetical protein
MTKHSSSSSSASCAASKKCKKPCASSSSSSCCSEQCVDCCSSQYQRLSRFSAFVVNQLLTNESGSTSAWVNMTDVTNRCGAAVPEPNNASGGAYETAITGCTSGAYASTDLDGTTQGVYDLQVALSAYYFVNEFAYNAYEPGCRNDQVWGWYVDLSSGQLQLFTETDGVPTSSTRLCLSNETTLTSSQSRQLKVLNRLYRLSKSAVKEVNGIPSQEGNIVEVCDCKGQRWLLYINTAAAQNGSPLASCNYQFAVVATKLC